MSSTVEPETAERERDSGDGVDSSCVPFGIRDRSECLLAPIATMVAEMAQLWSLECLVVRVRTTLVPSEVLVAAEEKVDDVSPLMLLPRCANF